MAKELAPGCLLDLLRSSRTHWTAPSQPLRHHPLRDADQVPKRLLGKLFLPDVGADRRRVVTHAARTLATLRMLVNSIASIACKKSPAISHYGDSMKPKNRWPDAHVQLKRLYDERIAEAMTQTEFGAKYDIGTQGMVWQYLSGYRPLNFEVAAKFARGLRCTIYDISPEMAEALNVEILPFLGKALRRAAALATFALLPALFPQHSEAKAIFVSTAHQLCIMVSRRLTKFFRDLLHVSTNIRSLRQANV